MKLFTINLGRVTDGIKVETFKLASRNKTKIAAITIGQKPLVLIPVELKNKDLYSQWKNDGQLWLFDAEISNTRKGNQLLLVVREFSEMNIFSESEQAVFLANSDRDFGAMITYDGDSIVAGRNEHNHLPFPGNIISSGEKTYHLKNDEEYIDHQIMAQITKDKIFCLSYVNYFLKREDYLFKFNGKKLISASLEDRELIGI